MRKIWRCPWFFWLDQWFVCWQLPTTPTDMTWVRATTICLFFLHWLWDVYGTFFASQFQLVPCAFDWSIDVVSVDSRSKPNRFPSYIFYKDSSWTAWQLHTSSVMITSFDGRFVFADMTPLLIMCGSNGFSRSVARHPEKDAVIKFKYTIDFTV